jgi:glutamine amidotransferase
MSAAQVVVLDYGSGNVRSACRALERAGASVSLTSDRWQAAEADGLVVPGVGAFATCMSGLTSVGASEIVGRRLAGGRAVFGICVGMQVMFDRGVEHGVETPGFAEWPGTVEELRAEILPHMGWNTVRPAEGSRLFAGVERERFYFVHSYGVQQWTWRGSTALPEPLVTWSEHGAPFVSAIEHGPLVATQFHPEKSGEAGQVLLRNWLSTL